MRVRGFAIDGFGALQDLGIDNLPPGLTLILGDNEAGKSTCLAFLRQMLFGFPRANSPYYFPHVSGGRLGGFLHLESDQRGAITIERRQGAFGGAVTVALADGRAEGAPELHSLLGGTTAELYRNVYAFSLGELQEIDSLDNEAVKSVIYAAGSGAGSHALPQAESAIAKQLEALFLPRAQKPAINVRLREWENLAARLREARGGLDDYRQASAGESAAAVAVAQLQERLGQVRRDRARAENYLKLWDDWVAWRATEERRGELGGIPEGFPADGVARLAELETKIAEGREQLTQSRDEIKEKEARIKALAPDGRLLNAGDSIQLLVERGVRQEAASTELAKLQAEQIASEQCLEEFLVQLGSDWSVEKLGAADRSLFVRDEVRTHQEELRQATNALEQAERLEQGESLRNAEFNRQVERLEAEISADGKAEAGADILENLRQQRDVIVACRQELPDRREECRDAETRLAEVLRRIDPRWDEATLEEFDCGLAAREAVQAAETRLAEAHDKIAAADAVLTGARYVFENVEGRLAGARGAVAPGRAPLPPLALGLWLGATLAAGIGVASLTGGNAGVGAAVLATAAALGVAGLLLARPAAVPGAAGGGREFEAELQDAQAKVEAAAKEKDKRQAELEAGQSEWAAQAEAMRLPPGATPTLAHQVFLQVDSALAQAANVQSLRRRVERLQDKIDACREQAASLPSLAERDLTEPAELLKAVDGALAAHRDLFELQAKRKALEEGLQTAQDATAKARATMAGVATAWRKWLEQRGLDPELNPETALEALETIDDAVSLLGEREKRDRVIGEREESVAELHSLLEQVYADLGRELPPPEVQAAAPSALQVELGEAQANQRGCAELERELPLLETRAASLRTAVEERLAQVAKLLEAGQTEDAEEFRRRGQVATERAQLEAAAQQLKSNLHKMAAEPDWQVLADRLEATSREDLQAELGTHTQTLEELEGQLGERQQERAEHRQRLAALSSSDEVSRLRAEQERQHEELRQDARKWTRLALAKFLLTEAKRRFEREQQPRVIRTASTYFQAITGGRYERIVAPAGEKTIEVVAPGGERKTPAQLSRGAAEQLFLAVRFGYISTYTVNGEGLPIVMDDILVNFDPARARQAAAAIVELAAGHQVLFFTCHPATVSLFREQEPGIPLYHLAQGALTQEAP